MKKIPTKAWITVHPDDGFMMAYASRAAAIRGLWEDEIVMGPYVLEERAPAKKKGKRK